MSRRAFKPSLVPSLATLLIFTLLLALGIWQISRSQEKQALLEAYAQAPTKAPISLRELNKDWLSEKYRRIELSGRYDDHYQILIENQLNVSQYGYIVLTPFHLSGSDRVILVNRGWVLRIDEHLPEVGVNEGERTIVGLVGTAPGVGFQLGSLDDAAPGWPKRVPYIEMDWLALQMAAPVAPWVVLLDQDEVDGFHRKWQPSLRMGPEKHKGYAFQWFTLGLALIFLFVAGSMKPQGPVVEEKQEKEDKQ